MSSVSGVNLNSLLSALGSSSSGFDVSSAVAQAIAALSTPETQWETDQTTLQTQTTDINQVNTDVSALQTSLSALSDSAGALASMTATSSDTSVANATAATGTAAGTHVVIVNNIASTASAYSSAVASSSTALASGSFTLQVGSGEPTTITVGSGGIDTLDQLAASINGQNLGVSASVVNDQSGSRLALVSNSSGTANSFTISKTSGLSFTQAAGVDASLSVDGIPIDSASNTVTGVISGLTLNLTGANPGGQVSITVAPDSTQASEAIASFVGAYNTAIGDVNTQYSVSATNQEGPLAGDSTIQMLQDTLLSAGSYSGGGSGVATLADLGITMNNDGTLTLNSTTLNNAIQNNFSGVETFMQGTASNGFAATLNNQLNSLTDPVSGAFTVDLQSISSENKDLQDQINTFKTYISSQQTLLTAEYSQADITLQEIPQEEAQINAELGYAPTTSTS